MRPPDLSRVGLRRPNRCRTAAPEAIPARRRGAGTGRARGTGLGGGDEIDGVVHERAVDVGEIGGGG
jgi:hypothetical protein